jgi:hypothetical protein
LTLFVSWISVWDLYKEQVEKYNDTLRKLGRDSEMISEEEMDPSMRAFLEMEKGLEGNLK